MPIDLVQNDWQVVSFMANHCLVCIVYRPQLRLRLYNLKDFVYFYPVAVLIEENYFLFCKLADYCWMSSYQKLLPSYRLELSYNILITKGSCW